jgi:hypothetical protein
LLFNVLLPVENPPNVLLLLVLLLNVGKGLLLLPNPIPAKGLPPPPPTGVFVIKLLGCPAYENMP